MQKETENPLREVIEKTIARLEHYCAEERGRKTQVARALLVHPSQVARWIARGGLPRLQTFVELINFLDRQVQQDKEGGSN